MHTPLPVSAPAHEPAPVPSVSAKEAAAGFTFHKDEPKKSNTPMLAGGALVALLLAGAGWYPVQPGCGRAREHYAACDDDFEPKPSLLKRR